MIDIIFSGSPFLTGVGLYGQIVGSLDLFDIESLRIPLHGPGKRARQSTDGDDPLGGGITFEE